MSCAGSIELIRCISRERGSGLKWLPCKPPLDVHCRLLLLLFFFYEWRKDISYRQNEEGATSRMAFVRVVFCKGQVDYRIRNDIYALPPLNEYMACTIVGVSNEFISIFNGCAELDGIQRSKAPTNELETLRFR
jgi:hypothetical protein